MGLIAVTGGSGFIGSRLLHGLHDAGYEKLLEVDLAGARNGSDALGADFLDDRSFLDRLETSRPFARGLAAVLHQGACVDTTILDRGLLRATNARYPARLLRACLRHRVPFVYASSAAVYGTPPGCEAPVNEYGRSKLLFDCYVRSLLPRAPSQVVGLRYFNVYGTGEAHKGAMASMVFQLHRQLEEGGPLQLFAASHGYADGEHRRDFVAVEDVVAVNLWFLEHGGRSGVYDVGTGRSVTFNRVAELVIETHGEGVVEYVPMPAALRSRYQSWTRADPEPLRAAGYGRKFTSVERGVRRYVTSLMADRGALAGTSSR